MSYYYYFFFTSNPLCNHSHRNCVFIKLINPQHEKVLWKKNKKQIVTVGLLKNNMYSNNLLKKTKLILDVIEKKMNDSQQGTLILKK